MSKLLLSVVVLGEASIKSTENFHLSDQLFHDAEKLFLSHKINLPQDPILSQILQHQTHYVIRVMKNLFLAKISLLGGAVIPLSLKIVVTSRFAKIFRKH